MTRYITVHVKPTTYRRKGKLIHRRGYTYKRRDVGKRGKGPKVIPIERGKLTKYGYSTSKSASARRRALRKAIRTYGALSVFRMLNAQVVLRKRTQRKARSKFKADRDWVRENFLGGRTRSRRKRKRRKRR